MGYIVYELLVGLAAATASEADPQIARKIHTAQVMTVISWCTYPVVYLFPMFGFSAAKAVVSIQVAIASATLFLSAELAWLSIRSLTPSLERKLFCNRRRTLACALILGGLAWSARSCS